MKASCLLLVFPELDILLRREPEILFLERFIDAVADHLGRDDGVLLDEAAQHGVRDELRLLRRQRLAGSLVAPMMLLTTFSSS